MGNVGKILLVEDDQILGPQIHKLLQQEKHLVDFVTDGSAASDHLRVVTYDLIILDWMLPDTTGVDLLRQLRAKGCETTVLLLTAFSGVEHKVSGFESGADDYLTKPFFPKELVLRVSALLRRPAIAVNNVVKSANLVIDPGAQSVTKDGQALKLTPTEFSLLMALVRNPKMVMSSETLVERAWPTDTDVSNEQVRKYVQRLRQKIDIPGRESPIRTVHGVGYAWEPEE
jgi:DNA-binding response OmpR family regulator